MRVIWLWGMVLPALLVLSACDVNNPQVEPIDTVVPPEAVPSALPSPMPTSEPNLDAGEADPYQEDRQKMVETGVIAWGIEDEAVIQALRMVPRHAFVPDTFLDQAYANHPLPIGFGQTISQPYIVALMTEAAELSAGDVVLEVGTGSGYQAAVLAEIVDQVYTMEIISDLAARSSSDLARLAYDNVQVENADGYFGWQEFAPFDAIVVTAAPDHVPQPLIGQLKIGGHMIIPVGPIGGVQTLWRISRISEEEVRTQNLGDVRFVPFTRKEP